MIAHVLSIALVALGATAPVEPPVACVELVPPVIPFHQTAEYRVIVEGPADMDVHSPENVDHFPGLAVKDVQYDQQNLENGRIRWTQTFVLDAIFVRDYTIPPATVTVGDDTTLTTPAVVLRVRDLTEDERKQAEQFAPIAGPVPVEQPQVRYWLWAGAIVLAVLVLGAPLGWFLIRRRRRARIEPEIPAWERAYARLHELDERKLPQQGKFEPFYVDLSAILRYYIEDRFQLRAPEETTPEFLDEASRSGQLSDEQQRRIAVLLRHCDLVKFAQYEPSVQEMEQSFTEVLYFVDETVIKEEAGEEEAAA